MAKLTRVTNKVFAGNAEAHEIGQFGSAISGAKLETGNVEEIQNLDAWEKGWSKAAVSNNRYATLQEMNGVQKVNSYQTAYLAQEGIPEWDAGTTYYQGSIVKTLVDNVPVLYYSLTDDNTGNVITNGQHWSALDLGGGGAPLFSTFWSEFELEDPMVHVKDGSVIYGEGIYAETLNKLKSLQTTKPNMFCTQEEYDTSISTYGECLKFVVNNDSFKLPTQTSFVEGALSSNELGILTKAGLPNITGNTNADIRNTNTASNGALGNNSSSTSYGGYSSTYSAQITNITFDASRSNPIYGRSNTVQPKAGKGYWYIVIATGIKSKAEIDLENITTELNNKVSKTGDVMSGDLTIKRADNSWLTFKGQNPNLDITNIEKIDGNSPKTVRLFGVDKNNKWLGAVQMYASINNSGIPFSSVDIGANAFDSDGVELGGKWFKVMQYNTGQFRLMANGQVMRYVVDTYRSGNSWWRLWSDGWLEQGGRTAQSTGVTSRITSITLLKNFKDTTYSVFATLGDNGTGARNDGHAATLSPYNRTTSSFKIGMGYGENTYDYVDRPFVWKAEGYAS